MIKGGSLGKPAFFHAVAKKQQRVFAYKSAVLKDSKSATDKDVIIEFFERDMCNIVSTATNAGAGVSSFIFQVVASAQEEAGLGLQIVKRQIHGEYHMLQCTMIGCYKFAGLADK